MCMISLDPNNIPDIIKRTTLFTNKGIDIRLYNNKKRILKSHTGSKWWNQNLISGSLTLQL